MGKSEKHLRAEWAWTALLALVVTLAFTYSPVWASALPWETPHLLPGRIKAEDYRPGGHGIGYRDHTPGNIGGAYRGDDVDIESPYPSGDRFHIGWVEAGEWLAYDVRVQRADRYRVTVRMASAFPEPKTARLKLDGAPLDGGVFTLIGGDGWYNFKNVSAEIALPAEDHVLQLVFDSPKLDSPKLNVNYIDVKAGQPLVLGMYNNTAIPPKAEGNTSANFEHVIDKFFEPSRIIIRRSFNPGLPTSFERSAARNDPPHGLVSFLSVKPPGGDHAGVAAGKYDAAIKSLAQSMPVGTYLTMNHEPENDMTGPEFVAMFQRFYSVAKSANPNISIGYIAMGYQWRPGSLSTATPDDWWPGSHSTDWLGCDTYMSGWRGAALPLGEDPHFQRWYQWALTKDKSLIIPEYGVEAAPIGFSDIVRADVNRRSLDWAWTQPRIRMVLYWNGRYSNNDGQFHLNPTTADPADRFSLSRSAWNEKVLEYGSFDTSID